MQAQAEVERNRQTTRGQESVQHPSDLGGFFMSMDFYDYRHGGIGNTPPSSPHNPDNQIDPVRRVYNADRTSVDNQIAQKSTFAKIKLPIPGNLKDNFRIGWEDTALGGFAGIVSDIYQASGALINGDGTAAEEAAGTLVATAKAATTGVARQLINNSSIGNIFDLYTGTAINQNLTVLFRGPTLKSHRFSWRLIPKSPQESANIKKIIAILKRASHPTQYTAQSSSVLRYPSECLIQFISPKNDSSNFLYPLRPCVLENIHIDYSPFGSMSLHQGTFEPTAIDISLDFKETSYYTRESFDNAEEYGYDGFDTTSLTVAGTGSETTSLPPEPARTPTTPSAADIARHQLDGLY